MEELVVTRFWMAGVMAVMLVYGGIALVGIARKRNREAGDSDITHPQIKE